MRKKMRKGSFISAAQYVVIKAGEEARRLNHKFVGTEHLLLCLISIRQSVAANVLKRLGISLETIRCEVKAQLSSELDQDMFSCVSNTPRVNEVLSLAEKASESLGHTYAGTGHLLLGILEEGRCFAARVLKGLGLTDINVVREAVLKELDPNHNTEEVLKTDSAKRVTEQKIGKMLMVAELGDRFMRRITLPNNKLSPLWNRWGFEYIELLLATGYNFPSLEAKSLFWMVPDDVTLEELKILCQMIERCRSESLKEELYALFNETKPDSVGEIRLGCLVQVLIGEFPRKLGPPTDWLKNVKRGNAHAEPLATAEPVVPPPTDIPTEGDAASVVTGRASINQPPPGGEH